MSGSMGKVILLLVSIVAVMIGLTILDDIVVDNVVIAAATEDLNVVVAGSTATVTLVEGSHWYTTTKSLTVTSDQDGDVTAGATVAANRLAVALTGLTTATHDFTVAYVTEDTAEKGTIGWKLFPLAAVGIAFFAVGGSIFAGVQTARKTGGLGDIGASIGVFVVLAVGAILGAVEKEFADTAVAAFAIQPDYTGVNSLLPLVNLGYVFSLIALAVGSIVGGVRGRFGA